MLGSDSPRNNQEAECREQHRAAKPEKRTLKGKVGKEDEGIDPGVHGLQAVLS